jgi:hypothetical protein
VLTNVLKRQERFPELFQNLVLVLQYLADIARDLEEEFASPCVSLISLGYLVRGVEKKPGNISRLASLPFSVMQRPRENGIIPMYRRSNLARLSRLKRPLDTKNGTA